MIYHQITLNGLDLITDEYFSTLSGLFDFEKDVVTNDMFTDGEAWGRSKNKPKTPTLNIAVMRLSKEAFTKLNQALAPNGLKRLELDTAEYGKIFGMVEIQSRMTGDSARLISIQLTMPDPYLYAVEPQSVQLGATYSTGVIFGPGHGVIFAAPKTVLGNPVDLSDALKVCSVVVGGHTAQDGSGVKFIEKWEGTLAGARNLALGTSSDYSTPYTNFNGGTNLCLDLAKVLVDGLSVGDTVTIHLFYKYDNIVAVSGQSDSVWMQGSGDVTGWGSGTIGAAGPTNFSGSGLFEIKRSFTVTADHLKNAYWDVTLRHDYIQSGSVQWKIFKVEKGNVADYSPAPEDLPSYLKFAPPKELLDGDSYDFIAGHGMTAAKQPITGTPNFIPSRSTVSADNGATVTAVIEPEHGDAGQGITFGSATGESGTLTNSGNADAYPVITVVGTCSGISVRNIATGEHIDISAALGDSDTLVIDCRPATCGAYLNGVPHIEYKTSPGWIHCPPGDNQFSFSRNSLQNKKHCTAELRSRWI